MDVSSLFTNPNGVITAYKIGRLVIFNMHSISITGYGYAFQFDSSTDPRIKCAMDIKCCASYASSNHQVPCSGVAITSGLYIDIDSSSQSRNCSIGGVYIAEE